MVESGMLISELKENSRNVAYIDGQNLYSGAKLGGWAIDHAKLRIYLKDKYNIGKANYFLGFKSDREVDLYKNLEAAGFILHFKDETLGIKAVKTGNVDTEIIFSVMKDFALGKVSGSVFLISGDGDYKNMIGFLINKNKFGKILFPNKVFASSLYLSLGGEYFDYLDNSDIKEKIQYIK